MRLKSHLSFAGRVLAGLLLGLMVGAGSLALVLYTMHLFIN